MCERCLGGTAREHAGDFALASFIRNGRQLGFDACVTFVAPHDVFLACLLQGLGVARFSSEDWVGFLQGCALFERPDGTWRAEYCVPDLAHWRNTFIQ